MRLTFLPIAEEERLPFPAEVPNKVTREALQEVDAGDGLNVCHFRHSL
jgi:DNA-damage-inducible protein J